MSERLRRTVQLAGGFVYAISPVQNVDNIHTKGNEFLELTEYEKEDINKSLDMCDGIIFPGGIKFTPYDRYLLEVAIEKKIPVLGICLGMQMMSCYKKDIDLKDVETEVNHYQESDFELSHSVKICKDSKLYEIIGKEEIMVNSFHKRCASSNDFFQISAVSDDGIIEGIEYLGDCFVVGIQWHPEISYEFDDDSKKIIDSFIDYCKKKNFNRSI
jgi:putative glutamine amidotransferase